MRLTAFRPPGAPAALAAALLLAPSSAALAQADPFGALYNPPPGAPQAKEASSGRTGSTSVGGAVGRSYANAQASGQVSLAQLDMMPDIAPPLPVALQGHATRYLANRPRIVIPGYTLAFVQGASASAFGGGAGLDTNQRRTQIATRLVGLTDAMAQDLADAAHADLVAQLEAAGFEVRVNPSNPLVKERVMAVNRLIQDGEGHNTLAVNTLRAPNVAECLEQQIYDQNGQPDKKDGKDHANDALGYILAWHWPSPSFRKIFIALAAAFHLQCSM
ncbi:MAG: hypothetical protein B7Z13_09045 [Caulobacterales bacterium 32-67-6]|nr:MAG: hypothetical protein B7Z13_09045 [Caulobacterales bacterium 32-67-6]